MSTFDPRHLRFQIHEMDDILTTPFLLESARRLTLHPRSGMNGALNTYQYVSQSRSCSIDALGIFAYYLDQPIGWALFTYESDGTSFHPDNKETCCGQVFVQPEYRRKGIGKRLLSMAARLAVPDTMVVYAWEDLKFFNPILQAFPHVKSL